MISSSNDVTGLLVTSHSEYLVESLLEYVGFHYPLSEGSSGI
jgi:hypothetical protein